MLGWIILKKDARKECISANQVLIFPLTWTLPKNRHLSICMQGICWGAWLLRGRSLPVRANFNIGRVRQETDFVAPPKGRGGHEQSRIQKLHCIQKLVFRPGGHRWSMEDMTRSFKFYCLSLVGLYRTWLTLVFWESSLSKLTIRPRWLPDRSFQHSARRGPKESSLLEAQQRREAVALVVQRFSAASGVGAAEKHRGERLGALGA